MHEIYEKIAKLKKEKDAVVLAHYYVPGEVMDAADYVGDSYYLSKIAAQVSKKAIIFCGVYFMGESAKILAPDKTVLMADISADCPMAHMASADDILKVRKEYEDVAVVCYVNSTAEIKADSDVCVTSSNAYNVVKSLANKNIYFIPDENLGRYIAGKLPEKTFIFNDGYCHVHAKITAQDVVSKKSIYPKAKVAAHPECREEVLNLADYIGSTSGIIEYVNKTDAKDFIICTETGVFYEINKKAKGKNLYPAANGQICEGMKKNTLDKLLNVLINFDNEVILNESVIDKAAYSLRRMLTLAEEK